MGFFCCGQSVADQAGDGHGPGGVFRGGEVGADDAGQRETGCAGGGLAAVPVDGDVGDLGREVVAGDEFDGDDDQRDQDADLGHGGGEFLDAPAGVTQVVGVLGDLGGVEFDDHLGSGGFGGCGGGCAHDWGLLRGGGWV